MKHCERVSKWLSLTRSMKPKRLPGISIYPLTPLVLRSRLRWRGGVLVGALKVVWRQRREAGVAVCTLARRAHLCIVWGSWSTAVTSGRRVIQLSCAASRPSLQCNTHSDCIFPTASQPPCCLSVDSSFAWHLLLCLFFVASSSRTKTQHRNWIMICFLSRGENQRTDGGKC